MRRREAMMRWLWMALALAADLDQSVPVQGLLTDADGRVISGAKTLTFKVYEGAATTPFATHTTEANVDGGLFGVRLPVEIPGTPNAAFAARWRDAAITVTVDGVESAAVPLGAAPLALVARWADRAGVAESALTVDGVAPSAFTLDSESVAWSRLSGLPAGLNDGDNDTTYTAGPGVTLSGTEFRGGYTASAGVTLVGTDLRGAYTAGSGIELNGAQIAVAAGVYDTPAELTSALNGTYVRRDGAVAGDVTLGGAIDIGDTTIACDSVSQRGTVRFTGSLLQICTASGWRSIRFGADGLSSGTASSSCRAIFTDFPTSSNGVFWIDPNNTGTPFQVLCNFTLHGGGWTGLGVNNFSASPWTEATMQSSAVFGTVGATNVHKTRAYGELKFTDVLFAATDASETAMYAGVDGGTRTMQSFVVASGQNCATVSFAMTAGNLAASSLCNTRLYFGLKDFDGSACSTDNDAWGPGWSGNSNNGCPHDDPDHFSYAAGSEALGNLQPFGSTTVAFYVR